MSDSTVRTMSFSETSKLQRYGEWLPALVIAVILAASLPFKFTGHPQPTHIFDVVGSWLGIAILRDNGALIIGGVELVAAILVLIPSLRVYGAGITFGVLTGAIIFHVFSPLGTTVTFYTDAAGNYVNARAAEATSGPYGIFDGETAFVPEALSTQAADIIYYQGVDSVLFILALVAWTSASLLLFLRRGEVMALLGKGDA